jgi:hypothetical protein
MKNFHSIKWKAGSNMVEKICEVCGKKFFAHQYRKHSAKYCSTECFHKSTIVDKSHVCKNCEQVFLSKYKDRKFCSVECACEYRRKKPKTAKISKDGYKRIWLTDGSSIKEHTYIMEQHIGRKLKQDECVHHIDGNRSNNDIENLQLMTIGEHSKLHRMQEMREGKNLFGRGKCYDSERKAEG